MVDGIVKRIAPGWSARQISILFTIIAIMLWSYSTLQARLDIGFFGLIHSFPISFFAALAFLTVASAILWVSPGNHEKLLFLQWSLLITALWLNPILLGATGMGAAPGPNGVFGNTEYIIREGHLTTILDYHNWPATWIFSAALMEIAGINDPSFMIGTAPFTLQFLFLLPLYLFLRNMLGEGQRNYIWAALWIFAIGNWTPQSYLSAQAFGFFLLLTLLALLTKTSPWKRTMGVASYQVSLLLILVLAGLTITHLFTSVMALAVIIGLYVVKRVKGSVLHIISAVFIVAWMIYATPLFFEGHLLSSAQQAFRFDILTGKIATGYGGGSASYQAVALTRILHGVIFLIIPFAGYILGRKVNRDSNMTVLAIAAGPLALAVVFGYGYGAEITHRIFLFELPVMAYFGVKLLKHKAAALTLCILLIILLPVHFISHYGGEITEYMSPGEIAGSYFFRDHTTHGVIIGGQTMGKIKYAERYSRQGGMWLEGSDFGYPEGDIVGYLEGLPPGYPHYVAITPSDKGAMDFNYNDLQFWDRVQTLLDNAPGCNFVYVNPDVNLYFHETRE